MMKMTILGSGATDGVLDACLARASHQEVSLTNYIFQFHKDIEESTRRVDLDKAIKNYHELVHSK
jgi:ketopantoate reductase